MGLDVMKNFGKIAGAPLLGAVMTFMPFNNAAADPAKPVTTSPTTSQKTEAQKYPEWRRVKKFEPNEKYTRGYQHGFEESKENPVIWVKASKNVIKQAVSAAFVNQGKIFDGYGHKSEIIYETIPGENKAAIFVFVGGEAYLSDDITNPKTGLMTPKQLDESWEKIGLKMSQKLKEQGNTVSKDNTDSPAIALTQD